MDFDGYLKDADAYLDEQAAQWERDSREATEHAVATRLAAAPASSGADVAAALGRYMPQPTRRGRRPAPLSPDKQRALELIAGPAARQRLAALRDRLATRSDADAIAGDTDRALGPGWRKPC